MHKRFYLKRIEVDRLVGELVPGWIGVYGLKKVIVYFCCRNQMKNLDTG